jgi:hypothetical protein
MKNTVLKFLKGGAHKMQEIKTPYNNKPQFLILMY